MSGKLDRITALRKHAELSMKSDRTKDEEDAFQYLDRRLDSDIEDEQGLSERTRTRREIIAVAEVAQAAYEKGVSLAKLAKVAGIDG